MGRYSQHMHCWTNSLSLRMKFGAHYKFWRFWACSLVREVHAWPRNHLPVIPNACGLQEMKPKPT